MQTAVRLDHSLPARKRILFIDWVLGSTCNQACSYCPPKLHNGAVRWHLPTDILAFLDRIRALAAGSSKSIHVQFTGGEPTVMPGFIALAQNIHARGVRLSLISNGSRTRKFWTRLLPLLHSTVLSFHPEFAEPEHFLDIVRLAGERIRTHVNVCAHPDYFDLARGVTDWILAGLPSVTVTLKPLLVDFGSNLYSYTPEQMSLLRDYAKITIPRAQADESSRGAMVVSFADGRREVARAADFLANRTNRWKGWECDIGLESLSIDMHGNVYRGLCRVGGKIGSIKLANAFALPSNSVRCERESCHCMLDIMTSRRRR
jgi:organic radical activating enzyme